MTTFGEIVEPSSRNVWEDWDEGLVQDYSRLCWQNDIGILNNIESLIVLEGKYLSDSLKVQTDIKMDLVNSVPQLNLDLYKITEFNKFICVIKDYDLVQSSEIVELMKDLILKSNNVVTILTRPLVEYQSEVFAQDCIIRCLSTSTPVSGVCGNVKLPKLEQPNIISGVSSGVVWLRENMGLPALAVVIYLELAEEQKIQELQTLLQNLNIATLKPAPAQMLSSNLYV